MKAKKLIKILEDNPEAEVTISVSDEKQYFFADRIVEVTNQGENQITIVADINKNSFISDVSKRYNYEVWDDVEGVYREFDVLAKTKEEAMIEINKKHPKKEVRFKRNYAC